MYEIIALDIGGTNIKYGIVDETGGIVGKGEEPTDAALGGERLLERIMRIVDELLRQTSASSGKAIGISTAGQVDRRSGKVISATGNLPGWGGTPLGDTLQRQFRLPVRVENDVHAAALGEMWLGTGSKARDFVMLTLGTGVGGAIVLDNRLVYGHDGMAGSFAHMRLYRDGLPCGCGLNGCFEQYASVGALVRAYERRMAGALPGSFSGTGRVVNGETVFEAEKDGDPAAREAVAEWLEHVSWGIANIVHGWNPDLVLIGGGVSRQGAAFADRIQDKVSAMLVNPVKHALAIQASVLANDAGMIGAAYRALQGLES